MEPIANISSELLQGFSAAGNRARGLRSKLVPAVHFRTLFLFGLSRSFSITAVVVAGRTAPGKY
jgi:hypothetical protein